MQKYIGSGQYKKFLNLFQTLTYSRSPWEVWQDFITIYACAISNSVDTFHFKTREENYLKCIKKYKPEEQETFPKLVAELILALEKNPEQDFLGEVFMKLNLGNEHNGQFFTPYNVCKMMAEMMMQDVIQRINERGYISISDPACGAGAMLIAAVHSAKASLVKAKLRWQDYILAAAQDINSTAALMCYIQLTLLGVAGYVKIGDTLLEPISFQDSPDCYWFTPMYFSDVWTTRRLISSIFNN